VGAPRGGRAEPDWRRTGRTGRQYAYIWHALLILYRMPAIGIGVAIY